MLTSWLNVPVVRSHAFNGMLGFHWKFRAFSAISLVVSGRMVSKSAESEAVGAILHCAGL